MKDAKGHGSDSKATGTLQDIRAGIASQANDFSGQMKEAHGMTPQDYADEFGKWEHAMGMRRSGYVPGNNAMHDNAIKLGLMHGLPMQHGQGGKNEGR
jgi:hypothetical protein